MVTNDSCPLDLSILIVCYRSRDDIDRCISSVLHSRLPNVAYEILLVNNADDGLESYVADRYPTVRIIENRENLGFGPGNNLLALHARGEKLLLLNPDTECPPEAIARLLHLADRYPAHQAWGAVTRFADGSREFSSMQAAPGIFNETLRLLGLSRFIPRNSQLTADIELVEVLSGAFMMVNRSLWEKLEGFDERFFMYSEEVDLCRRITRTTGLKLPLSTGIWIYHYVGRSSNPARRTRMIFQAKMLYERKHFPALHNRVMGSVLYTIALSRYLTGKLLFLTGRRHQASALIEMYSDLVKNPQWLQMRIENPPGGQPE